jgi:hypothetical protein
MRIRVFKAVESSTPKSSSVDLGIETFESALFHDLIRSELEVGNPLRLTFGGIKLATLPGHLIVAEM